MTADANCTDQLYIIKCWAWSTSPPSSSPSCDPEEESVVRSCSRPWSQAASACPLYRLPVSSDSGVIYQNPHCAVCNGVNMNDTHCHQKMRNKSSSINLRDQLTRFPINTTTYLLNFKVFRFFICRFLQHFINRNIFLVKKVNSMMKFIMNVTD